MINWPSNPTIVTDGILLKLDADDSSSYSGSGATWLDISGNRSLSASEILQNYNADRVQFGL